MREGTADVGPLEHGESMSSGDIGERPAAQHAALHEFRAHLVVGMAAYARAVLSGCPLGVAVSRTAEYGGLRSGDWLPLRFAVKELVLREHDPKAYAALPERAA
jgi:hypothetical protein